MDCVTRIKAAMSDQTVKPDSDETQASVSETGGVDPTSGQGACALTEEPKEGYAADQLSSDFEKCKDAFNLLWPDANGTVHKDRLLDFFKSILGNLYSEDMAGCLVEIMNPDENGNITMENFVHAFSLAYWTPESVEAMHNVLVTNPDIISKLADWKNVLRNIGLEMDDTELDAIIQQAQARATALLSAELARSSEYSEKDKEEVHRKSGEILESIHARLSAMDQFPVSGEPLGKQDEDANKASVDDKVDPSETM